MLARVEVDVAYELLVEGYMQLVYFLLSEHVEGNLLGILPLVVCQLECLYKVFTSSGVDFYGWHDPGDYSLELHFLLK